MASFCSKEAGCTLAGLCPKFVAWNKLGSVLLLCLTPLAVVLVIHTIHYNSLYREESQKHSIAELKGVKCSLFLLTRFAVFFFFGSGASP